MLEEKESINVHGFLPYTLFSVRVEEVIYGFETLAGEEIVLMISGSFNEGTGEPTGLWGSVEPGKRYLMFVSDFRPIWNYPGFGGDGFARFELTDDLRVIPGADQSYPGVSAITGVTEEEADVARASASPNEALRSLAHVTVAEVREKVLAAIAEAPLPTPFWMRDIATPTPTKPE